MKKTLIAWSGVILYYALILASVPLLRKIQTLVSGSVGRSAFGFLVLGSLGIFFTWLMIKQRARSYPWLIGILLVYLFFTLKLWPHPEEAVHFIEYGVLSFLVYRALKNHLQDITLYFTSSLVVMALGIGDEVFQWVVPDRYWDFRDVGLNLVAAFLMQMILWKGLPSSHKPVKLSSLRLMSTLLVVNLVLLGLCASNTPAAVNYYTKKFPSLGFLKNNPQFMSEFGYKIKDSQIGTFFSRYSREQLLEEDRLRGREYGRILRSCKGMDYNLFLSQFNPVSHPFLYEMRIHLFRRDHYKGKAGGETVAYREDLILRTYFAHALEQSGDELLTPLRNDPEVEYVSPVSSHLFTRVSLQGLWIIILFFVAFILLLLVLRSRTTP